MNSGKTGNGENEQKEEKPLAFARALAEAHRELGGSSIAEVLACQLIALELTGRLTRGLASMAGTAVVANPQGAMVVEQSVRAAEAVAKTMQKVAQGALPWLGRLNADAALNARLLTMRALDGCGWANRVQPAKRVVQ